MGVLRPRINADKFISASRSAVASALEQAGPTEIATRLKGMPAHKRAMIALVRIRVAGVEPDRIIAIVLAVHALIEEDPKSHWVKEFRTVQISKANHRLASGYHRVWEIDHHDGRTRRIVLNAYPRSSGPVLRLIGRMLEEPCEWVLEKHLAAVIALKVQRYGRHPALPPKA